MGSILLWILQLFSFLQPLLEWLPFVWFLRVLDILTLFYFLRAMLRYWKRWYEQPELAHLKIILPRNDSKLDNERRTEKDFREAVGRAEQLFRALHETRDLNLYNIFIKRWIWGKPYFSFELQYENEELSFVVVCDQYYQNIVEKQITSFYESAEVMEIPLEERFMMRKFRDQGLSANGYYLHLKKQYWFPIQTYKKIEDDPLNTIANSFSGLTERDKAAVQIVMHPRNHRWRPKARQKGTDLFKGEYNRWEINIPVIGTVLKYLLLPFQLLLFGTAGREDDLGLTNAPGATGGDHYVRMLQTDEEIAKSIGDKANQPGFVCAVRLVVATESNTRTDSVLNAMFVAWNVFFARGMNQFENRRIIPIDSLNAPIMLHNFDLRLFDFLEHDSILTPEELATMYHFPDARYNKISTIKWLEYKVLPPPVNLPEEGIILGETTYRGKREKVRILREDRMRHCYVVGKSGVGKSVLLENMASQDIANGDGVCVIDPHGDLIDDILSRVPKHRAKDVVVFDPSDIERPMGLNLLQVETTEQAERASLDAMEIFIKLFGNEIFGPRIQHYFRNGCLTLMSDKEEPATLIDIPRLFIDDAYQKYKLTKVTNPIVRAFWENEMAKTGAREKEEMIPYFTSKFGPFITNVTMRNIIGQTRSAFDIRKIMDEGKILLVSLSKGKIGQINAQLLGLVLVSKVNMCAMARADMLKEDRRDFFFYVDEFQNFATDTFAGILSEARKYRLGLTMAHQYIAQLSEAAAGIAIGQKDNRVRDAVFGNVGTMMSFKVGADDAEFLEKEYAPLLSAQDILSIGNYKAYLKLNIHNTTSRPFSLATIYQPELHVAKVRDVLKQYSRLKYGRQKDFVDAEIEARLGITNLAKLEQIASTHYSAPTEAPTDAMRMAPPPGAMGGMDS